MGGIHSFDCLENYELMQVEIQNKKATHGRNPGECSVYEQIRKNPTFDIFQHLV